MSESESADAVGPGGRRAFRSVQPGLLIQVAQMRHFDVIGAGENFFGINQAIRTRGQRMAGKPLWAIAKPSNKPRITAWLDVSIN